MADGIGNSGRWRRIGSWVLDLLYPAECALCGVRLAGGQAMCGDCSGELPRLEPPFCPACGQPFDGDVGAARDCPNCHGIRFAFDFARPAMRRDERTLELVHGLKYGRQLHLAGALGELVCEAFHDQRLWAAVDESWLLVPVPLHRSRLRWRHFNQSAEIGRVVAQRCGLRMVSALKRVRPTGPQTALGRRKRMANLRGAFALTRRGRQVLESGPSGVVLVDDVLTTGSTAHECARMLRRAGFRRVVVLAVMRG